MPPISDSAVTRHAGAPNDDQHRTSLDDALDDTFPASDPVAATAGAGGEVDTDPSPQSSLTTHGDDAVLSGPIPGSPIPGGPIRFPTSRRAGMGTADDRYTPSLRPNAVQMLQADHAHLFLTTQKFKPRLSFDRKRAIVDTICITLEVHLQIKEEIFLPAMSDVMPADDPVLAAATDAIEPIRDEIARLRALRPWDDAFDTQFMTMMNTVLHGIADEETRLLPVAQARLADQLDALGAQMSHRRMQLMGPHLAALTINTLRTLPLGGWLAGAGAFAGGLLLARTLTARRS